jgi:hypothetical protein
VEAATVTSGILSFLGGSAARAVWGEASAWITSYQDHKHELERMKLQSQLDGHRHTRDLEHIRLAKELGVKEVPFQNDDSAWLTAVDRIDQPTGFTLIDAWNRAIRPAGATVVIVLWVLIVLKAGLKPSSWDLELMAAILGFFYADRTMGKRGK